MRYTQRAFRIELFSLNTKMYHNRVIDDDLSGAKQTIYKEFAERERFQKSMLEQSCSTPIYNAQNEFNANCMAFHIEMID